MRGLQQTLLGVVLALAVGPSDAADGVRGLHMHEGRLVFSELRSETAKAEAAAASHEHALLRSEVHGPLYGVEVNLDIEGFDSRSGVTMKFDRVQHTMRLDSGLSAADGLAWGRFEDNIETTGWGELYVDASSSPAVSNDVKMYAAGFVEGILTCVRMSQFHANNHQLLIKDEAVHHSLMNIRTMLENEVVYLKGKANLVTHIMADEPTEPYWKHARYVLFQLWGLMDGYNYAARHFHVHTLNLVDMLLINSDGEQFELMESFTPLAKSDRIMAQSPPIMLEKQTHLRRLRDRRRQLKHEKEQQRMNSTASGTRKAVPLRGMMRAAEGKRGRAGLQRKLRREVKDGVLVEVYEEHTESHTTSSHSEITHEEKTYPFTIDKGTDKDWEHRMALDGRCSAFVKVTEGNLDLLVGHSTWGDYSEMTRLFKYYNFPLPGSDTMAKHIGMSSYPGLVSSTDDFYVMDSGLAVLETTLEILNPTLFDKVMEFPTAPHLPSFMHIMITNRLAKTATDWGVLYARQNTGTYNSQWMIVDYNRFVPSKPVSDNVLWVIESIPGQLHKEDMSATLRTSRYWPSFNRPYFKEIREATGHAEAQKTFGALYSWSDNPRAFIFRRDGKGVQSLFDMRGLMERNMFPYEGVEPNEPGHAIAARMDLSPTDPIPNGAIDSKVTNRCLFKMLAVQSRAGPTHATLRPFEWADATGKELWPGWPHAGMPNMWNFGWVQQTPAAPAALLDIADC